MKDIKEIVVLSGKGGTGKTTVVASFAALAAAKVLADADVDAANLYLVLEPQIKQKVAFWSGQKAFIDQERCNRCNLCQEVCRFQAIEAYTIDDVSCEGCGLCAHVCPTGAIVMQEQMAGYWFVSDTRYGPLVHAELGIAQENSGKLVALVRNQAKTLAQENNLACIITDGPPGVGCPVISSLSGADLTLLVTEPTISGMHDLHRVLGVCRHFGVPALVAINKYDLNEENTAQLEQYCRNQDVEVAGRLPFDPAVVRAMKEGKPVVEYSANGISTALEKLWEKVEAALK